MSKVDRELKTMFDEKDLIPNLFSMVDHYKNGTLEPFVIDVSVRKDMEKWFNGILNDQDVRDSCLTKKMEENNTLLEKMGINKHDIEHVVFTSQAAIAIFFFTAGIRKLADVQGLSEDHVQKEVHTLVLDALAVGIAGRWHDIGYAAAVENIEKLKEASLNNKESKDVFDDHGNTGAKIMDAILRILFKGDAYKRFLHGDYKNLQLEQDDLDRVRRRVSKAVSLHDTPNKDSHFETLTKLEMEKIALLAVYIADKIHIGARLPEKSDVPIFTYIMEKNSVDAMHKRISAVVSDEKVYLDYKNSGALILDFNVDVHSLEKQAIKYFKKEEEIYADIIITCVEQLSNEQGETLKVLYQKNIDDAYARLNFLQNKKLEFSYSDAQYNQDWFIHDFQEVFTKRYEHLSVVVQRLFKNIDAKFAVRANFIENDNIVRTEDLFFSRTDQHTLKLNANIQEEVREILIMCGLGVD